MLPCKELNGCSSFFPVLSNHQIAFFYLSPQWWSSLCSNSHCPPSKVQPTNFLLLRPGNLCKGTFTILPSHACLSSLSRPRWFHSILFFFFFLITWVLWDFKLAKEYNFATCSLGFTPDIILLSVHPDLAITGHISYSTLLLTSDTESYSRILGTINMIEEREETAPPPWV